MPDRCAHVIKLGGSLLDLADLPARLDAWWDMHAGERALLLVGGGAAADLVRQYDARFAMTEEQGHWVALEAMRLNAHVLAAVLDRVTLVTDEAACARAWSRGRRAIVEPVTWLRNEAARGIDIPHRWTFTSDSIAAHLAARLGAARLTLLKSVTPARHCTRTQASEAGIVDADFAAASADVARIALVNLRDATAPPCVLA